MPVEARKKELAEMLVALGIVGPAQVEEYNRELAQRGSGTLWKLMQERGLLSQPQADTLEMATKGYIPIEAARVTVAMHGRPSNDSRSAVAKLTPLPISPPAPARVQTGAMLPPSGLATPGPVISREGQGLISSTRVPKPSGAALLQPPPPPRAQAGPTMDSSSKGPAKLTIPDSPPPPPLPSEAPPPAPLPSVAALVGRKLGKFQITMELGKGAVGTVFLAHHAGLNMPVAVKVLDPALARHRPELIDRFMHEARSAARINHPAVVRVLDCDQIDGFHMIVMEYVEGMTLSELLRINGRLPEERALPVAKEVCEGLRAAHSVGFIHRDIKPANILMTKLRQVKIADMGLAKCLHDSQDVTGTAQGVAMGTPQYFAPEQARDASSVDHRTDIYALGATLYVLLTGRVPFGGKTIAELIHMHTYVPLVPPRTLEPTISAATSALIERMMAKDPDGRPQTYDELLHDIAQCKERQNSERARSTGASFMSAIGNFFGRRP